MTTETSQTWYEKQVPNMARQWSEFARAVFDGELDGKTQQLIAAASATVLRCEHCTRFHIQQAKKQGASAEEISEALMVAALIASGTQLFWTLDAYEELLGGDEGKAPWFAQRTGGMGRHWLTFHDGVYEDSALDRKTKELIATAVGCLGRCTHCTSSHIQKAQEHGASKREVSEALMLASFFGSATQLMWMTEGYQELLG